MKKFENKVAVITGAASGIGLGLAKRCALEKTTVVLADIEENALDEAESSLANTGASILSVKTDVSNLEDVRHLAEQTINKFGRVDLLFNNAGVAGAPSNIWESTEADWQWIIGVNLMGVAN